MITDHNVLEGLEMRWLGDVDPNPAERAGHGGEVGVSQGCGQEEGCLHIAVPGCGHLPITC